MRSSFKYPSSAFLVPFHDLNRVLLPLVGLPAIETAKAAAVDLPVLEFPINENMAIFSFMGNSSTGKSTAAALAVSIAGNPTKGSNTLFRSWNGTRNALEGYLKLDLMSCF